MKSGSCFVMCVSLARALKVCQSSQSVYRMPRNQSYRENLYKRNYKFHHKNESTRGYVHGKWIGRVIAEYLGFV